MYAIIDKWNPQFLPLCGRPPEPLDQVREDSAVLSQTMYLVNYFYLAFGGPAPVKTAKIEQEFRGDFQVRTIRCWALSGLRDLA